MKYRYHIVIFFSYTNEKLMHSFNSDSELLKMSEIRNELKRLGNDNKGDFNVENISQTIND